MNDQEFVINLEIDDTEGHAIVEPDDTDWLENRLRRDSGPARIRFMPADETEVEEADVEGHAAGSTVRLRAVLDDDGDTEGHAISIHFPNSEKADAFRKRLVLTGVLAGTVALGAAGGIGLANMASGQGAGAGSGAGVQQATTGSDWTQAERRAAPAPATTGSDWTQAERPGRATTDTADDTAQSNIGSQQRLRPE